MSVSEVECLDKSIKDEEQGTPRPTDPQPAGESDDAAAADNNTSFSVDELTSRLRKSLTLDDQPEIGTFAAVVESEVDIQPDSADVVAEEPLANDSSTFFDCENKTFAENVSPDAVVQSADDIAEDLLPVQPEVNEPDVPQLSDTEDKVYSNSLEVAEEMADNFDQPKSPPIAVTKGSYDLNLGELDEYSNPFLPRKGLSNSPPKSSVIYDGAGDSNLDGEVDPFKPSQQLSSSPPAAAASKLSSKKPNQRRSINNNLPELVTDSTVSNPADSVTQTDAADCLSADAEVTTTSNDEEKQPETSEVTTTDTDE